MSGWKLQVEFTEQWTPRQGSEGDHLNETETRSEVLYVDTIVNRVSLSLKNFK